MAAITPQKKRPSEHWASFDDWNCDGTREHIKEFIESINKTALLEHASTILGSSAVSISERFSMSQHWCCFEIAAPDNDRFLVARLRLPNPALSGIVVTDASTEYAIQCEVATMQFLRDKAKSVPISAVHAYEASGSTRAFSVGAAYMLVQGIHGTLLQDVEYPVDDLPVSLGSSPLCLR